MADEELDQQVAPEQGTNAVEAQQETAEQQAEREEREGQLQGQEAAEQGQEGSETGEEDAAAKRSQRVQKRIDQLTKQRHEALREAEQLREENRKLKQSQTVEPPADDPRPSFDDYESVDRFQQEYDQWARRQAKREAEATQQPESGPSIDHQQAIDRIQNAAIASADKYPDFEAVVYSPTLPMTQEMVNAAAETESVADVLYHLGKNPQEAERLSQLNGTSLIREMGRLEARLEANAQGEAPGQTKAPDPIQPVQGARAKREPKNPDELDIDTWMERERERIAKQRR